MSLTSGPTVVVGVPAYDREDWLPAAIDSLLAQTYRDAAFVLVDDRSHDGSFAIATEYAQRDDRVVAVRNEHRLGLVGAWRRAFEVARERYPGARYFAWGSDHDHWEPTWLAALVEALDAAPDAVLAYPLTARLDDAGSVVRVSKPFDTAGERSGRRRLEVAALRMTSGNMVYGLFRISALERIGPFPYVIGPDRLVLAQAALLGEFRQVPDVLWHRRFEKRVTYRRQRRAFFPKRRAPFHTYVPWWLVHGAVIAWRYGLRGDGRPGISRPDGIRAAASYVVRSAFRRHRRKLKWVRRKVFVPYRLARRIARRLLHGRARDLHAGGAGEQQVEIDHRPEHG